MASCYDVLEEKEVACPPFELGIQILCLQEFSMYIVIQGHCYFLSLYGLAVRKRRSVQEVFVVGRVTRYILF